MSRLRSAVRRIAEAIGVKTAYHVVATWPIGGGGQATGSTTVWVKPWVHPDNYAELMGVFDTGDQKPNITSITKLGL